MRVLIIGRFQPFHLGHLSVIERIYKREDVSYVIIGIGSAQCSHTLEDPFTAGERHLMISKSLESEGILNYYMVPIEDINYNALWVSHVRSLAPPFDITSTNNPLVKRLFGEAGYKVEPLCLYNRSLYSGTKIRELMVKGDDSWKELVPNAVSTTIEEIDGVGRLKALVEWDQEE